MKVVGITGGIGSGKTTVCKIFELLGIPVFYADDEAKKFYNDKKVASKVVKLFGKTILNSDKKIDKKKLAEIVFSDKSSLAQLNSIIHPQVQQKFIAWKKTYKDNMYVIKEAAIMVESGSNKDVNYLISITADKQLRINRIKERDKVSDSHVENRISQQISDKERAKYSDAIIVNDGKHSLIEQVMKIHNEILKK